MATIEIDDKKIEAEVGQMIIEVADEHGITIPRFCYHKHLSVAANCRMCLVEVEKMRKPLPACATPVTDGMKVYTKSPLALAAQKSVMEFLLINHPLDCPICDQGGECELQDVSLGYGQDVSNFSEGKRSVDDEDLGALISTEMTRCIHCTRCVRFGEEVAGIRELGATGRGENMRIGTYLANTVSSEVSANVIDLCPVGALTNKPYRYTARAWELQQKPSIAPHDCLGSNIYVHARRQKVMRAVPRDNESINQTWLSDRDRFSVHGLYHEDRIEKPMVKQNGQWLETDWETALTNAVLGLKRVFQKQGENQLGGLASASSTVEEAYLFQKLLRAVDTAHIDHRTHQADFSDQDNAPLYPGMDFPYEQFDTQKAILLVGSNIQREQPLAGLRIRHAQNSGADVMAINAYDYDFNFTLSHKRIVDVATLPNALAEVAKALVGQGTLPEGADALLANVVPSTDSLAMAKQLNDDGVIVLGATAINHPNAATIRSLAHLISQLSGAKVATMTEGANAAGCWQAGVLPHRKEAGKKAKKQGYDAVEMFEKQLPAYLLLGVEPEYDCASPSTALEALMNADFVVSCTAFRSPQLMQYADVILPITPFTETSGSFVNVAGTWQSFHGAVKPLGDARPAWKVLRVLGNLFDCDGFDFVSSEDVKTEIKDKIEKAKALDNKWYCPDSLPEASGDVHRLGSWGIYQGDALQRRSSALQSAASNDVLAIHVNEQLAKRYNLRHGKEACAVQEGGEAVMTVVIDAKLGDNTLYIANGFEQTVQLDSAFGITKLK